MWYKAPEGCGGCSVGGQEFSVKDGMIEVPDNGDYGNLLGPHGFTACSGPNVDVDKEAEKAAKAAVKEAEKAEKAAAKAAKTAAAKETVKELVDVANVDANENPAPDLSDDELDPNDLFSE